MTEPVEALYRDLIERWNERDAAGMAALFADDGESVGFDGGRMHGRAGVHEGLAPIFADHPTASYVVGSVTVRPLGEDVALLRAIVGMVPPGGDDVMPDRNVTQTVVAQRERGDWRVVLFQNTPAQYHGRPDLAEAHTNEVRRALASG